MLAKTPCYRPQLAVKNLPIFKAGGAETVEEAPAVEEDVETTAAPDEGEAEVEAAVEAEGGDE